MPQPLFTPEKDLVPIVQEAGWASGPVWTGAENLVPTGIQSPDRPARSQSLYWLCYPAHCMKYGFKKFHPRTDGENEGTIVVKLEVTCRAKWQVSAGGAIPSPMWPVTEPISSTQSTIFTLISGVLKVGSELWVVSHCNYASNFCMIWRTHIKNYHYAENTVLLGYNTVTLGNQSPAVQDNVVPLYSRVRMSYWTLWSWKTRPPHCLEASWPALSAERGNPQLHCWIPMY